MNQNEGFKESKSNTNKRVPRGFFQKANQEFLDSLNNTTSASPQENVDYEYSNYVYNPQKTSKPTPKKTLPRWLRFIIYQFSLLVECLLFTFLGRLCFFSMIGGIYAYNNEYTKNVGMVFILGSLIMSIGVIIYFILKNKEEPFMDD